jgi:hypothetical protein
MSWTYLDSWCKRLISTVEVEFLDEEHTCSALLGVFALREALQRNEQFDCRNISMAA